MAGAYWAGCMISRPGIKDQGWPRCAGCGSKTKDGVGCRGIQTRRIPTLATLLPNVSNRKLMVARRLFRVLIDKCFGHNPIYSSGIIHKTWLTLT